MIAKSQLSRRWPFWPLNDAFPSGLTSGALLLLLVLATAVAGLAQGMDDSIPNKSSRVDGPWSLDIPTAEELMDSLLKIQQGEVNSPSGTLGPSTQEAAQLYEMALHQYLQELPRVQISREMRQSWWVEFGRQQELFWRNWRAQFDKLFQHHLEALWQDPYRRQLEKNIALTGTPIIFLSHQFGDLAIQGRPDGQSHLVAEISIIASNNDEAQRYAKSIDLRLVPRDSGLQVVTVYPDHRPDEIKGTSVSLHLKLPDECPLQVENSFGDLRIEDFTRGLKARTSHGTLEVRRCSGDLYLANRHGNIIVTQGRGALSLETSFYPITVDQFRGPVTITNRFGDVIARQIHGDIQVENSAGAVEALEISGDVAIDNRLGRVRVEKITGDLVLNSDGSPANIADVLGGTRIENFRGEIQAHNLGGDVVVTNREGNVDLALDEIRERRYRFDSAFGIIRLKLPPDPSALISAESRSGTIDSDFPLEFTHVGQVQFARGKLGLGIAVIQLDGQNSNIYLISSGR